jgi:hypothetical protein
MPNQPSLLRLGNSPELLEAMKIIIASPATNLDEWSKSILRAAFRQALSEAEQK